MKAETSVRRSVFTALTAVCALTGFFWLQIKTIWAPFTEAATSVGTNPVAWFVVLMFILAVFAFHRPTTQKSGAMASTPRPTIPVSAPLPASIPIHVPDPIHVPARIYVDVSPIYLTDLYRGRTSIQADALAAVYKGKWIEVTGKVNDISDAFGGVTIFIVCDDSRMVTAGFPKDKKDKISHTAHGAIISLHGKILEINSYVVKLEECDLS